jgi:4-carboxymuconolactone decarboxylase
VAVEYKEHLRRLAVHDATLVGSLTDSARPTNGALDDKTEALVRVAATIAIDAATASFQHAVEVALSAGATKDEIVATLEAVTPVTGTPRIVSSAPKIALALGYDVEEALEELGS